MGGGGGEHPVHSKYFYKRPALELKLTFSEHKLDPLELPGNLYEDVVHVLHPFLHVKVSSVVLTGQSRKQSPFKGTR